jgi:hypothetical protein
VRSVWIFWNIIASSRDYIIDCSATTQNQLQCIDELSQEERKGEEKTTSVGEEEEEGEGEGEGEEEDRDAIC